MHIALPFQLFVLIRIVPAATLFVDPRFWRLSFSNGIFTEHSARTLEVYLRGSEV
jgi:hypothetical protein